MDTLTRVESVAAVLGEANVDTDVIFPARFLLLTSREGLGQHLFQDRRVRPDGRENPDFVLNRVPFRDAAILIAGENFGCGSSREQAVWALADRGIRVIIAPRFGEIFRANCLRNAVLPIALAESDLVRLRGPAEAGAILVVDLHAQTITFPGSVVGFAVAPSQREALLNGWDETARILNRDLPAIAAFETAQRRTMPWLHETKSLQGI